ncbi:VWA domain-containing protein [Streptomyces sp. NPDC050658]|uniref:VWA domain-containing protein n=1 Tax=unclassified Streptomyces TaxID=2593676 RepID=UPI0034351830
MNAPSPAGVPERLTSLVQALRSHGIRIGTGETVDAGQALEALGMTDRERIREGLAAALLHGEGQRPVFDPVFDLYFPRGVGGPQAPGGPEREFDRDDLRDRLTAALVADDRALLAQLAAEAVDGLGGYGTRAGGEGSGGVGGSGGSDGWSAHQTLSRLRPETLLARMLAAIREGSPGAGSGGAGFTDRLEADEARRRIEDFRRRVGAEARRRVAERRGADTIARRAILPTADRVDFLIAGRSQLDELRRTVQPLARKLATRLAARRRRAARGRIDLRRTLRGSLSTGGIPMRPMLRRRRPARPELVLLCDVSGSVAGFAGFTMLLVQALHDQFSKVRVFAFVNRVDEVTDLIARGTADPEGLSTRIISAAAVTRYHGGSDYGTSLGEFAERYADVLSSRSTVFVLGDARTNMSDPHVRALKDIAARARQVHWLNPERRALWQTGDSVALTYAELVDMHECRNAQQLSALIGRLLPV